MWPCWLLPGGTNPTLAKLSVFCVNFPTGLFSLYCQLLPSMYLWVLYLQIQSIADGKFQKAPKNKTWICQYVHCTYNHLYRIRYYKQSRDDLGFPGGSDSKESTCNAGDLGSIPGLGGSPGGRHGYPLQYSCVENPHGLRSLVGYSPWGHKESDTTEQPSTQHTETI